MMKDGASKKILRSIWVNLFFAPETKTRLNSAFNEREDYWGLIALREIVVEGSDSTWPLISILACVKFTNQKTPTKKNRRLCGFAILPGEKFTFFLIDESNKGIIHDKNIHWKFISSISIRIIIFRGVQKACWKFNLINLIKILISSVSLNVKWIKDEFKMLKLDNFLLKHTTCHEGIFSQ